MNAGPSGALGLAGLTRVVVRDARGGVNTKNYFRLAIVGATGYDPRMTTPRPVCARVGCPRKARRSKGSKPWRYCSPECRMAAYHLREVLARDKRDSQRAN